MPLLQLFKICSSFNYSNKFIKRKNSINIFSQNNFEEGVTQIQIYFNTFPFGSSLIVQPFFSLFFAQPPLVSCKSFCVVSALPPFCISFFFLGSARVPEPFLFLLCCLPKYRHPKSLTSTLSHIGVVVFCFAAAAVAYISQFPAAVFPPFSSIQMHFDCFVMLLCQCTQLVCVCVCVCEGKRILKQRFPWFHVSAMGVYLAPCLVPFVASVTISHERFSRGQQQSHVLVTLPLPSGAPSSSFLAHLGDTCSLCRFKFYSTFWLATLLPWDDSPWSCASWAPNWKKKKEIYNLRNLNIKYV